MSVDIDRRSFMIRAIIGTFIFIGAVMTAALGGFGILPALKKREPAWSNAGTVGDLEVNQPRERRFQEIVKTGWQSQKQERSVWLLKRPDGTVTAYSANCPHLGCGYRWNGEQERFECPCHGSMFSLDGKVLAGPAPRPLDTMPTRIENGTLLVQYQVYQLGTPKKMPA